MDKDEESDEDLLYDMSGDLPSDQKPEVGLNGTDRIQAKKITSGHNKELAP